MPVLRYINSPPLPGDFNMAADFTLAQHLSSETAVLRLYTWLKPTISLGFHQKSTDIDFDCCRQDGIDVVRRPTGGRAILHWQELTYCFIQKASAGENGRSVLRRIYQSVHQALGEALAQMGVKLSYTSENRKPQPHNPLCFASSAGSELEIEGKKVVGSAQRLIDNTILQHGSIILGDKHLLMPRYFNLTEPQREKLKFHLTEKSAHLNLSDTAELRELISQKIAAVFQLELFRDELKAAEKLLIEENRQSFALSGLSLGNRA